jgi:HNH endonuclease
MDVYDRFWTKGYGWFQIDGEMRRQHTMAFRLTHGEVSGTVIKHKCDNPPCCNPSHLISRTQKQNMNDASERKRLPPRNSESNNRAVDR